MDFVAYAIDHAFKTFKDVRVPKSQNMKTIFCEIAGSKRISGDTALASVLAAIQFDNQLKAMAGKVSDMLSYRNLTAETHTFSFEQTELLPQLALGVGRVIAEFSRQQVHHRATPTPNPSPQGGGESTKLALNSPSPFVETGLGGGGGGLRTINTLAPWA